MDKITVGVLTVSDRCSRNEATDESGPCLIKMISDGVVKNGVVINMALVPDRVTDIETVLKNWCDQGINLILTTGGTGISCTDVTPEATARILEKTLPGISNLMFKRGLDVTPLAALSRGIAGVREKTLIINLPGSKKASKECLEAVACVIPHAVDLITEKKRRIEEIHAELEGKTSLVIAGNPPARKRKSAYPCISVEAAQQIITERIYLLIKEEFVNYKEALGYVAAQDVVARDNLPPFDASLKDGYAVLSSDETLEKNMIGVSTAGGSLPNVKVTPGCCVRISTGAAVPLGADAVVQVEDTVTKMVTKDQTEEKKILFKKLPLKGQDIRPLGSDFKTGERLLPSKTYLDAGAIGLLAAAGVTSVRVYQKPLVGILSTGDELVSPSKSVAPGKIRDSNRITLISLLSEENFKAIDLGISPDEPNALRDALERGFRMADIVVTTGSMSMGERDYLKEVLVADFNAEICFGRVLMKPGKPTSFAIVSFENRPKLWFGLPGNPASAFVTTHLFLLPALRKISGYQKIFPISIQASFDDVIPHDNERPNYVRGFLTYNKKLNQWFASVKQNQSSSCIGSCVNANCLLELLPEAPEPKDQPKDQPKVQSKDQPQISAFGFSTNPSTFSSDPTSYNQKAFGSTKDALGFGRTKSDSGSLPPTNVYCFGSTELDQDICKRTKPRIVKAFVIGKLF